MSLAVDREELVSIDIELMKKHQGCSNCEPAQLESLLQRKKDKRSGGIQVIYIFWKPIEGLVYLRACAQLYFI